MSDFFRDYHKFIKKITGGNEFFMFMVLSTVSALAIASKKLKCDQTVTANAGRRTTTAIAEMIKTDINNPNFAPRHS